jgi:dodecin
VAVEELHDPVTSFGECGNAFQSAFRLVTAPVELVAAGSETAAAAGSPSRRSPDPPRDPAQADEDEDGQHQERHHTDHAGTIACAGPGTEATATGRRESPMSESVYRVTEVIGTSTTSWEEAAKNAVETAAKTLRDLRVGEVVRFDVTIEDGKVTNYRARVNISFKYESS